MALNPEQQREAKQLLLVGREYLRIVELSQVASVSVGTGSMSPARRLVRLHISSFLCLSVVKRHALLSFLGLTDAEADHPASGTSSMPGGYAPPSG